MILEDSDIDGNKNLTKDIGDIEGWMGRIGDKDFKGKRQAWSGFGFLSEIEIYFLEGDKVKGPIDLVLGPEFWDSPL